MSKVKTNLDLIQWLGDDMSTKVFSYLDDPRDLIRVSAVSSSWEKFVIQNNLCKRLCLKRFPEISGVVHSIEVDNVIELDGNLLERNHKIYAWLAFGLAPVKNNCISKSLFASSTNDDWDENFKNTLEPGDGNEDGPSYWSSIGQSDPSIPEALVYKLCSNICLVSEIHIQPYQDYFEDDCPIYSAKAVRFRLGCARHDMEVESNTVVPDSLTFNEDFKWTYTSPVFPMSHGFSHREGGHIVFKLRHSDYKSISGASSGDTRSTIMIGTIRYAMRRLGQNTTLARVGHVTPSATLFATALFLILLRPLPVLSAWISRLGCVSVFF